MLVRPFLKWVGGKRQLLEEIKKDMPKKFQTYYEPFIGGGAVFFSLKHRKAVINDLNQELINVYNVIKEQPEELIEILKTYKNESDFYYKIRDIDKNSNKFNKLSMIERAARIIYLNKTCFNGMFRVNRSGQFNVPFGRYKNPAIVNEEVIRAVSKYLSDKKNKIMIESKDFEEMLKDAKKGDFVYLDPPYDPLTNTSNFTGYTLVGFGKEEQKRLKKVCDDLNKKGVNFLLSNSNTEFINDLYSEYNIRKVQAKRSINSDASKRGEILEVLIKNYGKN